MYKLTYLPVPTYYFMFIYAVMHPEARFAAVTAVNNDVVANNIGL